MSVNAHPIQESQCPHQEDRSEGALLLPATKGSRHGSGQGCGRSRSFEPAGEIDIFHQGHVDEASHLFEDVSTDEQGLIAGGDTAQSRSPVHHAADDGAPHGWAIESDIEPSAHGFLIGQCRLDQGFRIVWKCGVGMEKQ